MAGPESHDPRILSPRTSRDFLAPRDVSVLARTGQADEALVRTLRQLGLTTVGSFAGLDRQHVVQRFAEAGQRAHDWDVAWMSRCCRHTGPRTTMPWKSSLTIRNLSAHRW